MYLEERQLAIQILTPCTLHCRLCADYAPLYMSRKENYYVTYENFCREIDGTFQVYDFIRDLTITGGEPLMHPQLADMVAYVLKNHAARFQTCRIFSNGTILPDKKLLDVISSHADHNFEWVLDHYGEISRRAEETITLLKENGIFCRVNRYYGEDQHCGGWVDYGSLDVYRNYQDIQAEAMFAHCHNATWKNLITFKGKIFLCTQAAFGSDMGFFSLKPDEYIDLFDQSQSLEEKKKIAAGLGHTVLTSCQYCNGFDVENSKRYPAGEQA